MSADNSTTSSADAQHLKVDNSVVRLEIDTKQQRHLLSISDSSEKSANRSEKVPVRKKSNSMSKQAKNVKIPEKSELSLMFDRIRMKNARKDQSDLVENVNSHRKDKPDLAPNSEKMMLDHKKVDNNVSIVRKVDIGHRNIDEIMEFDEMGKLRPKNISLKPNLDEKLTRVPNLKPKLPNLDQSNLHVDSPEKLNHESKISIFERKINIEKETVIKKTSSNMNINTLNMLDPTERLERSSSFGTLVRNPNPKMESFSRKLSISIGANIADKKNRKESKSTLTPKRSTRKHLGSEVSDIDSPGKRKLSPESTASPFKKVRSGRQTKGGQ